MSKIEWTNKTWNPIIGCTKVSEGCQNCYAERFANRLASIAIANTDEDFGFDISGIGNYAEVVLNGKWNGKTRLVPNAIEKPLHWKKPSMIFVCSMGDLFHESVPYEWVKTVFEIIAITPRHTYQILTKRPERMLEFFKLYCEEIKGIGFDSLPTQSDNIFDYYSPLENLWIGVTAENQGQANIRIPILMQIPAKVHFVSCEPLLSEIRFYDIAGIKFLNWLNSESTQFPIEWIIAGPETGPHKRPMQKEWLENLYKQCAEIEIPFFDKKNILELDLKQFPNNFKLHTSNS